METLRITERELARDVRTVLAKVQAGADVIIEEDDHEPVAVISPAPRAGRKVSDCIALAKAYERRLGSAPVPDEEMAADVDAGVHARSVPFEPPSWD